MIFIPRHIKFGKNRFRLPKLAFTAVDQNDIGDFILFYCLAVATTKHLIHCRIIITRRNTRDVIAAILGAQWSIGIEYHAGGYRLLAHRVADIKALHAFHCG